MKAKSSLGFLNPFLYQTFASTPDVFIGTNRLGIKYLDIVSGNNGALCCNDEEGFNAAPGWDPGTLVNLV